MMLPLSMSLTGSSSPRQRSSSPGQRSTSNQELCQDDNAPTTKAKSRRKYTLFQVVCLGISVSLISWLFAFSVSISVFAPTMIQSDYVATTHRVVFRKRIRAPPIENVLVSVTNGDSITVVEASAKTDKHPLLLTKATERKAASARFPLSKLPDRMVDPNSPSPRIAWLMSFPNR